MITFEEIWRKFSRKKYRDQYALSLLKRSVAFQVKTLRKKHCGTQAALAERSNLKQGVISRAEDQDYGNLTFNTVGRIASGLDMAFIGRFVRWSELAKFSLDLSEDEFANIPTFGEENADLGQLAHLAAELVSVPHHGPRLIPGAMEAAPRIGPHSELGYMVTSPSAALVAAARAVGE
jgi:transcriptional regulator with XRE-family HTH domain